MLALVQTKMASDGMHMHTIYVSIHSPCGLDAGFYPRITTLPSFLFLTNIVLGNKQGLVTSKHRRIADNRPRTNENNIVRIGIPIGLCTLFSPVFSDYSGPHPGGFSSA